MLFFSVQTKMQEGYFQRKKNYVDFHFIGIFTIDDVENISLFRVNRESIFIVFFCNSLRNEC